MILVSSLHRNGAQVAACLPFLRPATGFWGCFGDVGTFTKVIEFDRITRPRPVETPARRPWGARILLGSFSRLLGRRAAILVALLLLCSSVPTAAKPRSAKQDEAQRHFRLARIQFEQGKTQDSIESIRKALKLDPDFAEAHYYLGFIHYQQSEYKPATREFKKAIRLDPYYTDAHNHLGLVYREMKEYGEALREFRAALNDKAYKSQEKIHFNIGHLYLERNMYPEAIASFQKAVQLSPEYLRGILGLGTAYVRAGQQGLAEKELRKVVALGPDSPEAAEARQLLGQKVKQAGS